MLLLTACLLATLHLQDPVPQNPPADAPSDLTTAEAPIAAQPAVGDDRIEQRLQRILAATDRFEELRVDSEAGVVILEGRVQDDAERSWLVALTRRIEGVVAVLDRMTTVEPSAWDMRPALNELHGMWRAFVGALPRLGMGLLLLTVLGFVAGPMSRWVGRPLRRRVQSELLRAVVDKTVVVVVWLAGVYLFLRVSGLTQIALTVVGGTGVLGLVLGFAFRDIAENFLASVLISLQRPFRYGDTIEVDGHRGVVQRVTPRGTILMDFDGNHIQIANALVYKSTIKNLTANPNQRQEFAVGIGYDASVARAQEVMMGVLEGHSTVLADPRPLVLVEELGSATVTLRTYFWIDGTRHSPQKMRSAVLRMVLHALQQAGISMPDDAREVIFPDGVPVRMVGEEVAAKAPATPRGTAPDQPADPAAAHAEVNDAEGDLANETSKLNDQAQRARQPEEGEDVLAGRP